MTIRGYCQSCATEQNMALVEVPDQDTNREVAKHAPLLYCGRCSDAYTLERDADNRPKPLTIDGMYVQYVKSGASRQLVKKEPAMA